MQIWRCAVLRSLASHVICDKELQSHVQVDDVNELKRLFANLLDDFIRPRTIYSQVTQIITEANSGHHLTKYLDNPKWHDLEDMLSEMLRTCPPIFFYLDAVDDEFSHAPMYWLRCQEGLFHQVMRLLRDAKLGGRLHVVVSIRDVVMSSILRSEQALKYIGEPHIRVLNWDGDSVRFFLHRKLEQLHDDYFAGDRAADGPTVQAWLGRSTVDNVERGITEDMEDYLLRHTRLLPRDVVLLGNELCKLTRHGTEVTGEAVRQAVSRVARYFGDVQLRQCSNRIAADTMPKNAAMQDISEVYTGLDSYIDHVNNELRNIITAIGVDRFEVTQLRSLRQLANELWENCTDLPTVLWQNGLLGYVDGSARHVFYSLGHADQLTLPEHFSTFVLHPALIDSVRIKSVGEDPVVPT